MTPDLAGQMANLARMQSEDQVRNAEFEACRMRIEAEYREILEERLRRAEPRGHA